MDMQRTPGVPTLAQLGGTPSGATVPAADGYVAGQYYGPRGAASTTRTLAANELRLTPFRVRGSRTFDRIRAEVTGAGGSSAVGRLGIWNHDASTGLPGSLILDVGASGSASTVLNNGLIDGTNVSAQEVTISQALTAGVVWLGIATQVGTTTTYRGYSGGSNDLDWSDTSAGGMGVINCLVVSSVSGAFATLVGATFLRSNTAPSIILRAA